ncbi:MAG TPA: GtrA family protein [Bacteroidales bacterium]|nr:GtrA family protein [Bacteroidales bacterium]
MEKTKRIIKNIVSVKIIRFFLVAGLNTIFGYGILAFFLWIGLHYTIAGAISTTLGILFNFKTYGILVFNNRSNKLIFRFLLVYFITYCVGMFFIWAFSLIHVNAYVASAIIAIPNGLLGYVLNKKWVYEHMKDERPDIKTKMNLESDQ